MRPGGRVSAAAAILAVIAIGGARAAERSALVQVGATVNSVCRISAPPLNFGVYDPLAVNETAPLDGETRVLVSCTRAISGTLTLQPQRGTTAAALLVSGLSELRYSLYEDAARSVIWTAFTSGPGKKKTLDIPVYGRIAAAQDVPSGEYADTVTARLDF